MALTSGKFIATLTDYGMQLTKAGLPMVKCKFRLKDTNEAVYWSGSFNEGKAQEITLETLVTTFGFEGNDPSVLYDGLESRALNTTREYEITVEKNDAGYFNVKSVWIPGSEHSHNKNSKDEIVHAFKGLNVGATLAQIRNKKSKTDNIPF
jgi:hypothetical protein